MKKDQRGLAHVALIITPILITIAIAGSFLYVRNSQTKSIHLPFVKNTGTNQECNTVEGLRMCISSSKSNFSSSENAEIITTVNNTTSKDISETFGCDATDPSIILNGKDLSLGTICEETITTKTFKAKSSETFKYTLPVSKMQAGSNTLSAKWSKYSSGTINVEKNTVNDSDLAKQFNACQSLKDNIEHGDVPSYCATIVLTLSGYDKEFTCAEWKSIISKANFSIPCTDVMDIGTGYVYVPREDANKYLPKLKALPEVSDAFVDNE